MGRKREISSQQAMVLAGLGHKIHYFYDPVEAVGRPNGKVAATKRIKRKRRVKTAPNRIELTERKPGAIIKGKLSTMALGKVFSAAKTALNDGGRALTRPLLCRMVAKNLGKTEKAVQVQVSKLIKSGHLRQVKDAST